ncbi:MAG: ABC transporter permease, partial [Actinomycetaceae bacterium]|nr:ABC transporter permease [Actinomycetaceae bacterium]
PQMQTVISYESANGALVDVRTDTWLDQVYDHISVGSSTDKAIELTNEAMDQNSHAEVLRTTDAGLPDALMIFANFSTYPIFAFTVVIIVNLMSALNTSPIRQRLTSSPVTGFSRGLGLLGTTLIIGLIGWAWIFGLGMGVFPPENIPASLPLIGVLALALGAYTLVGVSVGFLMGQLGIRGNGAAAIANVGGMIFSFLAGAWVPLDYMPQSVLTISQLTPGYWAAQAISGASEVSSTSAEAILPLVQNCGIAALFGVAITAVALGVGRNRARASI